MPEKVRLVGDPILKQRCVEVDLSGLNSANAIEPLLEAMEETMKAEAGIGLAANQIGRPLRVFIMKNDDGTTSEYINPTITEASELIDFENEACLSIPGTSTTTRRHNAITLSWFDKNGDKKVGSFKGIKAFAVQHEMDHLDGKLYVDQFGPVKKDLLLRKHKKYLKQVGRQ